MGHVMLLVSTYIRIYKPYRCTHIWSISVPLYLNLVTDLTYGDQEITSDTKNEQTMHTAHDITFAFIINESQIIRDRNNVSTERYISIVFFVKINIVLLLGDNKTSLDNIILGCGSNNSEKQLENHRTLRCQCRVSSADKFYFLRIVTRALYFRENHSP